MSLTVEKIRGDIAVITAMYEHDYECAHEMEDGLYIGVLDAIAKGAKKPAKLASEALKITELERTRWYA